jgi:hypothetical protein
LGDALSKRLKMFKDMGKAPEDIAADPLIGDYTSRLDAANAEKLNALSLKRAAEAAKSSGGYSPEAASAPAKGTIGPDGMEARTINPTGFNPTAAPAEDLTQAPEIRAAAKAQADRQAEVNKAQEAIDREIASAWTEKKNELQADIEKAYSKKDLLGIASAIDRGDTIPEEMVKQGEKIVDEFGRAELPSYESYLLQKLKRAGTAFREPQNKRWGTQDVSQNELLRLWAEQYVREHSGKQSGQTVKPMASSGSPTSYVPPAGDTTVNILPR